MTRFVWLHGFASSPQSGKGQFMRARLEERGVHLVIPDLNEPSFFDLTVSRMLGKPRRLTSNSHLLFFGIRHQNEPPVLVSSYREVSGFVICQRN